MGWTATSSLGVLVDLTGNDGFLLVAAGHAAHDGGTPLAAAHVVLLDQAVGILAHRRLIDKAHLLEPGVPNSAGAPCCFPANNPAPGHALWRSSGIWLIPSLERWRMLAWVMSCPSSVMVPWVTFFKPRQAHRPIQSGRCPRCLPGRRSRRRAPSKETPRTASFLWTRPGTCISFTERTTSPGWAGRFFHRKLHVAPPPFMRGKFFLAGFGNINGADALGPCAESCSGRPPP